jgi:hypothetical protein
MRILLCLFALYFSNSIILRNCVGAKTEDFSSHKTHGVLCQSDSTDFLKNDSIEGVILNAVKFKRHICRILKDSTIQFFWKPSIEKVMSFEKKFKEYLKTDTTFTKTYICSKLNNYFRQYLGFIKDNTHYILVLFYTFENPIDEDEKLLRNSTIIPVFGYNLNNFKVVYDYDLGFINYVETYER